MKKLIGLFLTVSMLLVMVGSTTMAKGYHRQPENKAQIKIEVNQSNSKQDTRWNKRPTHQHKRTPKCEVNKTVIVEKEDNNETKSLIAGLILGIVLSK